jgi:hypothetical protein
MTAAKNPAAEKAYIEERAHAFAIEHAGPWSEGIAQFFKLNPELEERFKSVASELARLTMAARFQKEQTEVALNEDDDDGLAFQLELPGIEHVRLSPYVEVAPNDWRPGERASMNQHRQQSERLAGTLRRRTRYQEGKAAAQRAAAVAMENVVPGASDRPIDDVSKHWPTPALVTK